MSDGLSDVARDRVRGDAQEIYLARLADWLEDRTEARMAELKAAAEAADSVRGGYWSGRTALASRLEATTRALAAGDRTVWARLVSQLYPGGITDTYERLRKLCPFGDAVLMTADYGIGFVHLEGEFKKAVAEAMVKAGHAPYQGGDFIFVLPPDFLKNVEIISIDPKRR